MNTNLRQPNDETQGEVVAQRIAVQGEGSFFALPHPVMSRQAPSAEQFAGKLAWVTRHLAPRRTG